MSRSIPASARAFLILALTLVLVLGWIPAAAAQTPAEVQYGSPTGASDFSGDPASSTIGSSSASGDVQSAESLPSTGGPSLLLAAAVGSLALGAFGLLALRRAGGR